MRASDVPRTSKSRGLTRSTPKSLSSPVASGAPDGPTPGEVPNLSGPTNARLLRSSASGLCVRAGGDAAAPLNGQVLRRFGITLLPLTTRPTGSAVFLPSAIASYSPDDAMIIPMRTGSIKVYPVSYDRRHRPAKDVLSMNNRLKVIWIDARSHSAKMIQLHAFGHWAFQQLIGNDVCLAQSTVHGEMPVALAV